MTDPSPRPHVSGAEPPRAPPRDDPRTAALRAEVAARLRPVCGAMTADQFDVLVRDVVAFKLRWTHE